MPSLQGDETFAAATNTLVFYSLNNQKENDPHAQPNSNAVQQQAARSGQRPARTGSQS